MITKSAMCEAVDPLKFPIRGVRDAKHGGLIIDCKSNEEMKSFKENLEQKLGSNYDVVAPVGHAPKVRIIGLTKELTEDIIMESLVRQNEAIFSEGTAKIVKVFKAKNSLGVKLELDGIIFKKITEARRVMIGWDSCVVHEAIEVLRCYNCLGFHHTAKDCKSTKACIKCSQNHISKNCDASIETCVNCEKAKKSSNLDINSGHSALSNDCIIYKRKIEEERKRVDYEFVKQQQ